MVTVHIISMCRNNEKNISLVANSGCICIYSCVFLKLKCVFLSPDALVKRVQLVSLQSSALEHLDHSWLDTENTHRRIQVRSEVNLSWIIQATCLQGEIWSNRQFTWSCVWVCRLKLFDHILCTLQFCWTSLKKSKLQFEILDAIFLQFKAAIVFPFILVWCESCSRIICVNHRVCINCCEYYII